MTTTSAARPTSTTREERKVLAGTLAGTTIEWYDFFIYAQAATLVLAPLFLAGADPAAHGRLDRAHRAAADLRLHRRRGPGPADRAAGRAGLLRRR